MYHYPRLQPLAPKHVTSLLGFIFFAFIFFGPATQRAYAATIFVTPTGGGDGSSWGAATTLQNALSIATAGSEIWVKSGLYLPGTLATDTFSLKPGVGVYGGFAGTEGARDQRDWQSNVTVLSGDIDNNDLGKDANGVVSSTDNLTGTNSSPVITADASTGDIRADSILDGFTITAGNANGSSGAGGGFFCYGSFGSTCSPHLENIIFSANSASHGGGAMYNYGVLGFTTPTLRNVNFINNTATGIGSANSSGFGGAIYNLGGGGVANPSITDSTFVGNRVLGAISDGGAIYLGTSSITLENVTFINNSAKRFGGALSNITDTGATVAKLINVLFYNNSAFWGGALYSASEAGDSSVVVVNSTFVNNASSEYPGNSVGALYLSSNGGPSTLHLTNSIFWGNTPNAYGSGQILIYGATAKIKTSLIQSEGIINTDGVITDLGGNLESDPLFVNADVAAGNFRLNFGSPAIDGGVVANGNGIDYPDVDLDGNPRLIDGDGNGTPKPDMGAYEAGIAYGLTMTLAGNGHGEVVSSIPVRPACTASCLLVYPPATNVTLVATSATGSTFGGWSGACSGTTSCVLAMTSAKLATATFTLKSYALTLNTVGSGTINKTPNQATYNYGSVVTLTPSPATGFTFTGWSGACTGSASSAVTMDAAKSVTATFVQNPPGNHAPSFSSSAPTTASAGIPYTYAVVALDPDTGDTMTLSAPTLPSWLTLTPTGNGTATLSGTPSAANVGANEVQLRVQDAAGAFALQDFTITVSLPAANTVGTVAGTVVDDEGKGIEGATVTLTTVDGQAVYTALVLTDLTDATGAYLFENVPLGDYLLTVTVNGLKPTEAIAVTVQAGTTTTVPAITPDASGVLHLPSVQK